MDNGGGTLTKGLVIGTVIACVACAAEVPQDRVDLRPSAERFFTGVFGCEAGWIDEVAAENVRISYPIFDSIFGVPVVEGREAVKNFGVGFCSRWKDPRIELHEVLQDSGRVVLVWQFSALEAAADSTEGVPEVRHSWGGISLFRFDEENRLIEEVGEESSPGPIARTSP